MNILYYSNYCKHSKEVLGFVVKHDFVKSLNCICVDKRKIDHQSGQIQITLENGTSVLMPPNVHSVPTLMLVKENYRVISGKAILDFFRPDVSDANDMATQGNGEPMSFSLGSKYVMSESYTSYSASTEELSAKGSGGGRNLHHYVPAEGKIPSIQTPPDTYKPDKVSQDVTIDTIQQQRSTDVTPTSIMPFLPQTI
jgi:hypothetical protein